MAISEKELMETQLLGMSVDVPHELPFSFCFFKQDGSPDIYVRAALDPRQKDLREYGVLKLCGDWAFTPRGSGKAAAPDQIDGMRRFFQEYKALFAAVWEGAVPHDAVSDYFVGLSYWDEMLRDAVFYRQIARELPYIQDVQTLEAHVREHNLFSMNDQGACLYEADDRSICGPDGEKDP